MAKLLEKHIVEQLYTHLGTFCPGMVPFRKEFTMTNQYPAYRCDMLAYILQENGYKWPVVCEVKFNGNDRDLRLEIAKALQVRHSRHKKYGLGIAVFMDKFTDQDLLKYLFENDVVVYQYMIETESPLLLRVRQVHSIDEAISQWLMV